MQESHGEGVATHTDPELCVGFPRGGGEALAGARAGRVWNREISQLQGADAFGGAEGNTRRDDSASPGGTLRGRRPRARPETSRTGTGRSHGCLGAEGAGQAAAGSPRT